MNGTEKGRRSHGEKRERKVSGSMKVTCETSGRAENPRGKLEVTQVSIKSRTGIRIP